ncbi:unnamed protein product [Closterium sp. NIES-64]|nr:unnamed protein product [Closterium sp. NIES-64]
MAKAQLIEAQNAGSSAMEAAARPLQSHADCSFRCAHASPSTETPCHPHNHTTRQTAQGGHEENGNRGGHSECDDRADDDNRDGGADEGFPVASWETELRRNRDVEYTTNLSQWLRERADVAESWKWKHVSMVRHRPMPCASNTNRSLCPSGFSTNPPVRFSCPRTPFPLTPHSLPSLFLLFSLFLPLRFSAHLSPAPPTPLPISAPLPFPRARPCGGYRGHGGVFGGVRARVTAVRRVMVGHPQVVHGGATAFAFDETFGVLFGPCFLSQSHPLSPALACSCLLPADRACLYRSMLGVGHGFTANISVNYRKPLPAAFTACMHVALDRVEGRKYFLCGSIRSDPSEDAEIYSEASALFIIPRPPSSDVPATMSAGQ